METMLKFESAPAGLKPIEINFITSPVFAMEADAPIAPSEEQEPTPTVCEEDCPTPEDIEDTVELFSIPITFIDGRGTEETLFEIGEMHVDVDTDVSYGPDNNESERPNTNIVFINKETGQRYTIRGVESAEKRDTTEFISPEAGDYTIAVEINKSDTNLAVFSGGGTVYGSPRPTTTTTEAPIPTTETEEPEMTTTTVEDTPTTTTPEEEKEVIVPTTIETTTTTQEEILIPAPTTVEETTTTTEQPATPDELAYTGTYTGEIATGGATFLILGGLVLAGLKWQQGKDELISQ